MELLFGKDKKGASDNVLSFMDKEGGLNLIGFSDHIPKDSLETYKDVFQKNYVNSPKSQKLVLEKAKEQLNGTEMRILSLMM